MTVTVGERVSGKYRSAVWTGHIVRVIKRDAKGKPKEVAIRPDADSRHAGEPSLIHRYVSKIHKTT